MVEDSKQSKDLPSPFFKKGPVKASKKEPISLAQTMLSKYFAMKKDLDEKIAALHEMGKKCNIDIDLFFSSDLSGLDPQDVADHNRKAKALEAAASKLALPKKEGSSPKPTKSIEKMTKERKGKTRGARKKWIPLD